MKALVTGATGFTGSHLARRLAAGGVSVRALVRDGSRATGLAGQGIECCAGDLRDGPSLDRALRGVEVVYNIAALYRQAGLPADAYRAVNARAVGDLVERAARARWQRASKVETTGFAGSDPQLYHTHQ
jgi:uncharacterized protein YbjT (DUF2867 family)